MNQDRHALEEAKDRLLIPEIWRLLNLPGECKRQPCCTPWREDKHPSLSIFNGGRAFVDHATGLKGDAISFLAAAIGADSRVATRTFLEMAAGAEIRMEPAAPTPPISIPDTARVLRLPQDFHLGSSTELRSVSMQRGVSLAGVELANDRGLLWFGSSCSFPAWLVTDEKRVNAQARRLDGNAFPATEKLPLRKAHTLKGSRAAWPIGTLEAKAAPFVVIVEGAPDLLAGHALIAAEGRETDTAIVAMLGAAHRIPDEALFVLTHKRVRLFPHADSPGQEAAVRWAEQLENTGCIVDAFRLDGLRRSDGAAVNDLNDFVRLDADCFEAERADLEEVLPR